MAHPPDEPDETCPKIDKVIVALEALNKIAPDDMIDLMEKIRSANADLRERAQFFEEQAGEFEEIKDKAEARADEAEGKVKDLELSVSRLQARIDELESATATR